MEDAPAGLDLVDRALRIAEGCERPDLVARLNQTRSGLLDPQVRVLVVGEFKQGKSHLVNALVIAPVCPVHDDVATAVPTVVRNAERVEAVLVCAGPDGTGNGSGNPPATGPVSGTGPASGTDAAGGTGGGTGDGTGDGAGNGAGNGTVQQDPRRTPIPVQDLARYVCDAGEATARRGVLRVEVGLPRQFLADGLALVDTPGVGGLTSAHTASTLAEMATADAVLLVSDASQEYSAPEMDFLRRAMKLCPNVAGVLTKIDLYPRWRHIAELNRAHLAAAGVEAELFPVSSALRMHASRAGDAALNQESGFPPLVAYLREQVVGQANELTRRSAAQDILSVTDQLTLALRAELATQQDPERSQAVIKELENARTLAEQLRQRTARWQQTLNDGIQDLTADIDYDLRDRTRHIVRDAEAAINEADPGKIWDEFSEWLHQQVAQAVADNFVWTAQRARWLANQVAEHFAASSGQLVPDIPLGDATSPLTRALTLDEVDSGRVGIGTKLLVGVRGSYGGLLMVGLLTGLAGMALFNPISIGAGVLLGAKTMKEDHDARLKRRRGDAAIAVRQYVDEVVFQAGKDSRDTLRAVQRTLRDHFAALANEMSTSINDSVRAAQEAAKIDSSERAERITQLRARLEEIATLRRHASLLAAGPGS